MADSGFSPHIHQQFLASGEGTKQPDKPQLLIAGQLVLKSKVADPDDFMKNFRVNFMRFNMR
ncbi:hypothetical protein NCHU2750_15470 [Neorhizobium sp. NCHU2750]|nr:hypothetical protein NCHU2750_15470 [Neorhizobium sp. NCHU2750]